MIIVKTSNSSFPYALVREGATVEMVARVRDEPMVRLFAAAPEMLDLLKTFIEAQDDSQLMRVTVDEARKLVARVEG